MSGKDGSRGYLYQAIATVLNSLSDEEWQFVQIEPYTDDDKVDIMWEYDNELKKVAQVKSSINNFGKTDIIKWLELLTKDTPDAEEYSLILIGSCSGPTKQFINKVNNRNTAKVTGLQSINSFLDKINIQQENFEIGAMEAKIHRSLNKFMSIKGYKLDYFTLDMMAGGLVFQFAKFSSNGEKVSRGKFEELFLEWSRYNYPDLQGVEKRNNELVVQFYISKAQDFTNKIEQRRLKILESSFIREKKTELLNLMEEINQIELPAKKKINLDDTNDRKYLVSLIGDVSAELSDSEKQIVRTTAKNLLAVGLEDSFFFVGDLREAKSFVTGPFINSKPQKLGTEDEIKKGEKIDEFLYKSYELEAFEEMFKFLTDYYCIPLVLKNEGQVFSEKIRVIIKVPKEVEVLTAVKMKIPKTNVIKRFTGYNGLLNGILRHHKDSKVMDNINYSFKPIDIPLPTFGGKSKEELTREYKWFVKTLFDFEIHNDDENHCVLEYHFDELNPKENIAFSSFVLVKANQSFEIQYEITSKNLNDVIKGELLYIIE